mmetsp:Transcript_12873/g.14881  ORF Transcript_12873/g.14881 Transcript_12873/m.14881 type:complete len:184 (+) Transcript_12873:100-651(+)
MRRYSSLLQSAKLHTMAEKKHKLVGKQLPDVTLFEGVKNKVKVRELFGNKVGVILAVPGAFTPGCSKVHLPGYIENYEKILKLGADKIACISCNDAFVMEAWGKDMKAEGKVRMLADVRRDFTKALDMEVDLSKQMGSIRSKRYSLICRDGVITHFNEEEGGEIKNSAAGVIIGQLKAMQGKL